MNTSQQLPGMIDAGRGTILFIEGDPTTARAMTRLMASVDVAVQTVQTFKAGMEALALMPAVVILDLMLPDGCGIEILEVIRKTKMRCKVAVVSASTDVTLFTRLRAAQPDAVFSKPLDFEDFVQWLCEAFPETCGHEIAA